MPQALVGRRQTMGKIPVIIIQKCDVLPASLAEPSISCGRGASLYLAVDLTKPRVWKRNGASNSPVIDDDDLEVTKCLRLHGRQSTMQHSVAVQRRDDDA